MSINLIKLPKVVIITEKLIEEHISKFTKTLSPKTITFSGEQKMELKS